MDHTEDQPSGSESHNCSKTPHLNRSDNTTEKEDTENNYCRGLSFPGCNFYQFFLFVTY
jgi:hypothetical protein